MTAKRLSRFGPPRPGDDQLIKEGEAAVLAYREAIARIKEGEAKLIRLGLRKIIHPSRRKTTP
jgi:hypothetical protein